MSGADLTVALRAYSTLADPKQKRPPARRRRRARLAKSVLILDVETTTDPTQRLVFGTYRYCRRLKNGGLRCVAEGLFYADDLPTSDPEGVAALKEYVATRAADVAPGCNPQLRLLSRTEFVNKVVWPAVGQAGALVVGFNLPFDLSRLAVDAGVGRGCLRGGFSFQIWDYVDRSSGARRENRYRPRIGIKHIDSRRSFMEFTRPGRVDLQDITDAAGDHRPGFGGRFLDLRTLAFALTNESHTLASACEAFGVEHGKVAAHAHGSVTPEYIDYNRRDVLATQELLMKLLAALGRHPLHLDPAKVFSPASLAKAYLSAMGITLPAVKFQNVGPEVLAAAMMAYYGGRAEARIRRAVVPVTYCDFLSMYPTVNALMGLWLLLTAESLEAVDATEEVRQFLASVTLGSCFDPATWQRFGFFALVRPDGHILPVRARYDRESDAFNIGVNPVTPETPIWYAGPDLVAATLLTARAPEVVSAFRLVPGGRQRRLHTVKLRGAVPISPRRDDFFRVAVEARKTLPADSLRTPEENRLDAFLKVLANSGSYGVFAELNREEACAGESVKVTVHGLDGPFESRTTAVEAPGEFSFPPLAALITAGARLMLALLERCLTDAGGTYAFCDTDSMAIVSTRDGGLVLRPGGPDKPADGSPAIRALSWAEVDAIVDRFSALNPYDRSAVTESVLKIEKENYDERGGRRQLYAYVIAAKRYALFTPDPSDGIGLRKWSEHGLGHLLNPTDPNSEDREWIRQFWEVIVREALGEAVSPPSWLAQPAVSRLTISSWLLYRPFAASRGLLPYSARIKPFNFVLSAHVASLGHPEGADPRRFHLIAPYTPDPRVWLRQPWTDIHSNQTYGITTSRHASGRMVRVKSYRDVLEEYRTHPEPKSADAWGNPCDRTTAGHLQRRAVRAASIVYVGKESNFLEEVERGLVHDWDEVLEVHEDPRRHPWFAHVVPVLKRMPSRLLAERTGLSQRWIKSLSNGRSRPSRKRLPRLVRVAIACARRLLADPGTDPQAAADARRLLRSPLARAVEAAGPSREWVRKQKLGKPA